MSRRRTLLLACGIASTALAGCSGGTSSTASSTSSGSAGVAASSAAGGSSASATTDCTGTSCTVQLVGAGSQASVLGTTLTLVSVSGSTANLRAATQNVMCSAGGELTAATIKGTCTEVTAPDRASATVTPGPNPAPGGAAPTGNTSSSVSCTATECSIRLSGSGAEVLAFSTPLTLTSVDSGTATLDVGGKSVTCTQGKSVTSGSAHVSCSSVSGESVALTVTAG